MESPYPISLRVVIPNKNEERIDELRHRINEVCRNDKRIGKYVVCVVNDPGGNGYGHSLKRGIDRGGEDWICIIDADFSYSHTDLPRLIDEVPYSDMAVAERRGVVVASGLIRSFGRMLVKNYAIGRTKFPIVDINSGFRIFKRTLYDRFRQFLPDKYSFTTTITILGFAGKYRINYVPSFYKYRKGKSGLKPMEFFNFIRTIERCKRLIKILKIT